MRALSSIAGFLFLSLSCASEVQQSEMATATPTTPSAVVDGIHQDLLDGWCQLAEGFWIYLGQIGEPRSPSAFIERVDELTLSVARPNENGSILFVIRQADGDSFRSAQEVLIRVREDLSLDCEFHRGHEIHARGPQFGVVSFETKKETLESLHPTAVLNGGRDLPRASAGAIGTSSGMTAR